MFRCKIFNFFFRIFPLKIWQDFLIRRHIQKCGACKKEMASAEEVKSFLIQVSDVGNIEGLWPAVKAGISKEKRKDRLFLWPRLRWVAGVVAIVSAVAAGFWLYSVFSLEKTPSEEYLVGRLKINYIKVENKPARAYIFRPHDSEMIIIWAEKNI